MATVSNILRGQTFAIAGLLSATVLDATGTLNYRALDDVIRSIQENGGKFSERVSPVVNVVLSTEEMACTFANPYKLQFLPDFQADIECAQMHSYGLAVLLLMSSIPIVGDNYLDECLLKKVLLPTRTFLIPGFIVDIEKKFEIKQGTESSLDPRVQKVITMLFDQKEIDRSLLDLGVDVRRISLVTQQTIKDAWNILKGLEGQLQPSPNQTKQQHEAELTRVSNLFYSLIPHAAATPPIKTTEQIKTKSVLLEALTDIEIAQRLMKQNGVAGDMNMSPIDINYRKLRCEITPLEPYRSEYRLIQDMVNNTQSDEFKFKIELVEAFELNRAGEAERFSPYVKLPHHRLLWHGSRLSNFIGILSQGIRIAPPEAPVTGYFLGKGAYFADMVSVSGQYLHTTKDHPFGFMLLCDVALGRTFQLAHGKFVSKDDLDGAGFHSLKGPDVGYDTQTPEGLIVSLGHETSTGVPVSELIHNEIVVYDEAQIKMKYLLKVKFEHF